MLLQDGSTVAAVLVLDDLIFSANLGDSKAILCRRSASDENQLSFVHLSKDHNPSNVSYENFHGVQFSWISIHGILWCTLQRFCDYFYFFY